MAGLDLTHMLDEHIRSMFVFGRDTFEIKNKVFETEIFQMCFRREVGMVKFEIKKNNFCEIKEI